MSMQCEFEYGAIIYCATASHTPGEFLSPCFFFTIPTYLFSQLDISFPFLLHSHVWCAVGHKSDLMLQILVIINMLLSLLYLVIPSFIVEDSAEALSIGINTKYKFFALVCCCCCCIQVYNFCFY